MGVFRLIGSISKASPRAGSPLVLDFEVDPWDFPDGFKEFQPEIFGK
jgi:hypothetical protein